MAQEEGDVVKTLFNVIEFVGSLPNYRWMQRKECFNLVRRIKQLVPMLEEVREFKTGPLPAEAKACLGNLKKVFVSAKKLLRCCHDGSKIYLALESEAVMDRFHVIYEKLHQVLDGMPYDEIGISDEVKEQVELMCLQLKRSKKQTDSQDIEIAMDMMVVFSKKDGRNADSAILERLAKRMDLCTIPDLGAETFSIKRLVNERSGLSSETIQQIIDVLNKFRQIAGTEETGLDDVTLPKTVEKCPCLLVPNDFLCPISLDIMVDPVIVATGQLNLHTQTYERSSIQKWFDSNHRTCPKTQQILDHLSLAPNYALRNLILQWCEKNNVDLPKKEACASTEISNKQEISLLVQKLSSNQLDVQRKAVMNIRLISKENPDCRNTIANHGAIPTLVHLLSYPDSKVQEHTVTALLNLSIDERNKRLIAKEGAIPAIIEVLRKGTMKARENSAAALFSLSMLNENRERVGSLNGIRPLVDLLKNGTIRGKKDAATALFNLSLNHANKARALEAGIVTPLLQLISDKQLGMIDEALSILQLLLSHPEGRKSIGQMSVIETLVTLIREGTPKNKECATSVLLELALNSSSSMLAALQFGVYEHVVEVAKSGTNRAKRKANALLQHMSKCEHIP